MPIWKTFSFVRERTWEIMRGSYWMKATNGELLPSAASITKKPSYQLRHRWYISTTSPPVAAGDATRCLYTHSVSWNILAGTSWRLLS